MDKQIYYEKQSRGTPDFPIELYDVDYLHPAYVMQQHWHNDYEIIQVLDGALNLSLNEKEHTLRAKDSIVIFGGIPHSAVPRSCRYRCLLFSPSVIHGAKRCEVILKSQMGASRILKGCETVDHLFDLISSRSDGYEFAVLADIYSILAKIYTPDITYNKLSDPRIDKIKDVISYIHKHFSEDITLDTLASVCKMNRTYFCNFFKRMTHESPINFLINHRIECACASLRSGASVIDTTFSCGFNEPAYFIETFKKRMGVTPKQYQLSELKAVEQTV